MNDFVAFGGIQNLRNRYSGKNQTEYSTGTTEYHSFEETEIADGFIAILANGILLGTDGTGFWVHIAAEN